MPCDLETHGESGKKDRIDRAPNKRTTRWMAALGYKHGACVGGGRDITCDIVTLGT